MMISVDGLKLWIGWAEFLPSYKPEKNKKLQFQMNFGQVKIEKNFLCCICNEA